MRYNLIIEQALQNLSCSYLSVYKMLEACQRFPQRDVLYSLNNSHLKQEYCILFENVRIKMKEKDGFYAERKSFAKFICQFHLLSSVFNSFTYKCLKQAIVYL